MKRSKFLQRGHVSVDPVRFKRGKYYKEILTSVPKGWRPVKKRKRKWVFYKDEEARMLIESFDNLKIMKLESDIEQLKTRIKKLRKKLRENK
jgi:hypothetical protein